MVSLAPGVRIHHYLVEAVLPGGGFGQVVVARRVDQGTEGGRVALKIARTDGPKTAHGDAYELALINEVQRLHELRHPGIVTILPLASSRPSRLVYRERARELKGQPWYFAMEYLAGGPIADLIDPRHGLPPVLAAELTHQACMALDYMHVRNYAHLDVKPRNILLREPMKADTPPEAVLIDLGTAQKEGLSPDVSGASLHFLPPERIHIVKRGVAPETLTNLPAVDVYSLGITFYQMLTGRLPFAGSQRSVTTAIINDAPTLASNYATELKQLPGVDDLLLSMLAKNPNDRPGIREVAAEIDRLFPLPRMGIAELSDLAPDRSLRRWKVAFTAVALVASAQVAVIAAGVNAIRPCIDLRMQGAQLHLEIRESCLPATVAPPTLVPSQPSVHSATRTPTRQATPTPGVAVDEVATSTPTTAAPAIPSNTPTAMRATSTPLPTRTPVPTRPQPTAGPTAEEPQP